MARKLGVKNTRAGTGSISSSSTTQSTEKWVGSVAEQLSEQSKQKDDIVKSIPIDYIKTDQDNPRKLKIDIELVKKIAKENPIVKYIENELDNAWVEEYVNTVTENFNLIDKQIGDFKSIVEFATVLKSPKRLLHAIVVWKEESTFHLISGERRVLTHVLLGESFISAKIYLQKPSIEEIDLLQWEENIHREDMTLFEKVERVKKFTLNQFKQTKLSVRNLSKLSGLGRSDCQRYLAIINYPTDTLITAIKEGKVSALQKAAALAQLSDKELQTTLLGKRLETKTKIAPSVKISKNVDINAMQKIISLVANNYDVSDVLENLDLSKNKDINIAFNGLLNFLTEAK